MFSQVAVGIFIALTFILVWRIFKNWVFKIFEEIFVVYHVMGGGEGHYLQSEISNLRIYPFVLKTEFMDESLLKEIAMFNRECVDSELSNEYVRKGILKHSHMVLLRDRVSGALRGNVLFTFKRTKDYTLFVVGAIYVQSMYRGEMYLYLAPICYILRELFWHPFTPIYCTGKATTYKSYLGGISMFDVLYPCYNKKTPDHLKQIITDYGGSIVGSNEDFDPGTGVITRNAVVYAESAGKITDQDRKNPHIKFFENINPGWNKGNCLVVIAKLNWYNIYRIARRGLLKTLNKPSSGEYKYGSKKSSGVGTNQSQQKTIYTARKSFVHKETVSDLFGSVDMDDMDM